MLLKKIMLISPEMLHMRIENLKATMMQMVKTTMTKKQPKRHSIPEEGADILGEVIGDLAYTEDKVKTNSSEQRLTRRQIQQIRMEIPMLAMGDMHNYSHYRFTIEL